MFYNMYNLGKLKSIAYVNGNCDARQIQRDYCCKRTRFNINNTNTFIQLKAHTHTHFFTLNLAISVPLTDVGSYQIAFSSLIWWFCWVFISHPQNWITASFSSTKLTNGFIELLVSFIHSIFFLVYLKFFRLPLWEEIKSQNHSKNVDCKKRQTNCRQVSDEYQFRWFRIRYSTYKYK